MKSIYEAIIIDSNDQIVIHSNDGIVADANINMEMLRHELTIHSMIAECVSTTVRYFKKRFFFLVNSVTEMFCLCSTRRWISTIFPNKFALAALAN